jgi:hypothetical protein
VFAVVDWYTGRLLWPLESDMTDPVVETPAVAAAERWTSRKLWVTLIVIGASTWLRLRGALADDSYVTLMATAMVGYIGGNVAQRAVQKAAP